jgi:hypothetical protein
MAHYVPFCNLSDFETLHRSPRSESRRTQKKGSRGWQKTMDQYTVSAECGRTCVERFGNELCQQIRPVCVGPSRAAIHLTRALRALPEDAQALDVLSAARFWRDWQ